MGLFLACVSSVSVGSRCKERLRNGIFNVLPSHHFSRGQNTENPVPWSFPMETLATQARLLPKAFQKIAWFYSGLETLYTLFSVYIRTSNFGAEAERSYFFFRFEAENVLKTFFHLMTSMVLKLFWNRCKYELHNELSFSVTQDFFI